ncbi:cytosolic thiouridylase subunit Ctu1 [Ranunculus cassubicifolius]
MASVPPTSTIRNPRKSLGFVANALKRKDSFIQFIAMTGILLLSMRSLGQKYRLHHLQEDMYSLKEEQDSLTERMKNIKNGLLEEAAKDSTGAFAARLRVLFGSNEEQN